MNYPFTIPETNLLIDYLKDHNSDAIHLAEKCYKCLETGELKFVLDREIVIPLLPTYLSNSKTSIEILNTSIRDFFIVFKITNENGDIEKSIQEFWNLKYRSGNISKMENEDEHLIFQCNRYFSIDFSPFFIKKNRMFFEVMGAFSNTLHILNLETNEIFNALELITEASKGDGAIHMIFNSLTEFPKQKPFEAEELFDYIFEKRSGSTIAYLNPLGRSLSEINKVNKYLKVGLTLTQSENKEAIKTGLLLIGNLNYKIENEKIEAYETLCEYTNQKYGEVNFQATSGLLDLLKKYPKAAEKITELSIIPNIEFQYPIADYIWRNDNEAETSTWFENIIFNLLKNPSEHTGYIHYIESYINNKFRKGNKNYAYRVLKEWLKNGQKVKTIKYQLKEIADLDFNLFSYHITDWFLSSEINLLDSLLFITSIDFPNELKFDIELLNKLNEEQIDKIISAVIGFVYSKDALATLMLSILDSEHCITFCNRINEIFYNYICYTYPTVLEEHVKPKWKVSQDIKKETLKYIITNVDNYYNKIKELPFLPELSGSDKRIETFQKAFQKKQNKLWDKAEEGSFMSQVASNVFLRTGPILFGKFDEKYSEESELGHFHTSFEMPRAEYIDPAAFELHRIRMRLIALKK